MCELKMNRITSTIWIWILSSLLQLMTETTATPLLDFGARERIAKNKIQTIADIRFHDDLDDNDSSLFDPSDEASTCSKGSTFCENLENYPTTEFKTILKEANKFEELFGSDLVNPVSIGNRFGDDDEDEEPLCASQVRLVYPQAGLTKDNTWRYIVNQSNYTQGVRVEECIHRGQCRMMHSLPFGYKSQCKQKYVYRQLVGVDEDGNTIKDLFKIPSCCQCVGIRTKRNRGF